MAFRDLARSSTVRSPMPSGLSGRVKAFPLSVMVRVQRPVSSVSNASVMQVACACFRQLDTVSCVMR